MDRVVLDVRGRRHAAHPGLRRLRHAGAPSGPRVPGVPEPVLDADGGLRSGHGRRLHRQPAPVAPRPAAALRDRRGRPRRGPGRPSDHQHHRVRHRRRPGRASRSRSASSTLDDVWLPLFEPTGATTTPEPDVTPKLPAAPGPARRRAVRAPGRAVRGGAVGPRAPAHGRPALPDRRRLPGRGGRRRPRALGHRRAVHLPGRRRHGDERGRCGRRRGGAAPPSDLDQRRRRHPGARRGADRRHAGRLQRTVPARPVLPHRVGVDVRHPRIPAGRRRTRPRGPSSGARRSVPCRRPTGSP